MKALIHFEWIKIVHRRTTILVVTVALTLATIFFILFDLGSLSYFQWNAQTKRVDEVKGIAAIPKIKSEENRFAGTLTLQKIDQWGQEINMIQNNPNNYEADAVDEVEMSKREQLMLGQGYTRAEIAAMPPIKLMKPEARWNQLMPYQQTTLGGNFLMDIESRNMLKNYITSTDHPVRYEYIEGWRHLIGIMGNLVPVFLGLVLIVCITPIFSEEYTLHTDSLLLTARYGKSKLPAAKCVAALLFASAVFALFALLFTGLHLIFFGLEGGSVDAALLTKATTAEFGYPLTLFQWFLLSLLFGYLGTLMMTAIGLFLSAAIKKPFIGVVFAGVIFLLGFVDFDPRWIVQKICMLLPAHVMNGEQLFWNKSYDTLFGVNWLLPNVLFLSAVLVSALCTVLAIRIFSRQEAD